MKNSGRVKFIFSRYNANLKSLNHWTKNVYVVSCSGFIVSMNQDVNGKCLFHEPLLKKKIPNYICIYYIKCVYRRMIRMPPPLPPSLTLLLAPSKVLMVFPLFPSNISIGFPIQEINRLTTCRSFDSNVIDHIKG